LPDFFFLSTIELPAPVIETAIQPAPHDMQYQPGSLVPGIIGSMAVIKISGVELPANPLGALRNIHF